MTSQAIHGLKTSSSGISLSEGETFITKISKVPAVGQMISESHFLSKKEVAIIIFSLHMAVPLSVVSCLRQTLVRSEMAPDALVCTG